MNIGDLYFGFRGDSKQLVADAKKAGEQAGKVTGDAMDKSLSRRLKGAFSDFKAQGGIGGALMGGMGMGVGMGVFGAITSGIGAVTDFMGGAIDAASNLAESQSKVNVVFGDGAEAITKWSETSASALGLSQQAALEAVGTFGNLFDALGLTEQAAVDMGTGAVQLAADLASFNNTGVDEALVAIQSGLLGEAEPMRRFGSNLSAARVEAYALSSGLAKTKKGITDAIKVQARYALMVQDTANAQGDFARTSGGAAAQQKILDANIATLTATIGSALIGPMQGFTDWLNQLIGGGGSSGFLQQAADDVATLRKETEALAEAQVQEPGAWLGTGTVFDTALDTLTGLSDGLMRAVITTDDWTDKVVQSGIVAGIAEEDLRKLAKAVMDVGGTYQDYATIVGATYAQLKSESMAEIITGTWGTVATAAPKAVAAIATIPKATDEAADDVEEGMERLENTVTATIERVENKRGKGWHWKTDISAQLTDLRHQFKEDLAAIDYLIRNPQHARTKSALQKQLEALERRKDRVVKSGDWEQLGVIESQITDVIEQMRVLDGQKITLTADLKYEQGVARQHRGLAESGGAPGRPPERAAGGPVTRGMPYIVGERGRELFVPGSDGTIIPNGGGRRIDFYVHDPDGGLARAGITTSGLATALASRSDALSRWED